MKGMIFLDWGTIIYQAGFCSIWGVK
jgi:hypothetical protein